MPDASGRRNIWLLPLFGDRKPTAWLSTPADEWRARFSPNGRWIAYESDETGRAEIFVRDLDRPTQKWQISAAGGTEPRWRREGGELYFVSADCQMMAVRVRSNGTFSAETPRPLFELRRLASRREPLAEWQSGGVARSIADARPLVASRVGSCAWAT